MTRRYYRYIAVETAISICINVALSTVFVILLFGGRAHIPLWGERGVEIDFLPQTLMGSLMSLLVPTLIARRRVRRGALEGTVRAGFRFLSGRPIARCVLIAMALTVVLGAGAMGLTAFFWREPVGFADLICLKATYGAIIAVVATPLGLLLALSDTSSKAT